MSDQNPASHSRRVALACGALVAIALPWIVYTGGHQVDDAFIVYRYADHIAQGAGIVFNLGERVEGVSTLLWTFALVPFAALGVPLEIAGPWLSSVFALLLLCALPRLTARAREGAAPSWVDLLPSLLLLGTPAFLYWSRGALETVLFALLLVLALNSHLAERREARVWFEGPSWLWFSLAIWTRPEAPLFVAAAAIDRFWSEPRDTFDRFREWSASIVAALVALLLMRWVNFGEWLPNTYYAKAGAPLATKLRDGLLYSLSAFADLVPFAFLPRPLVVVLGSCAVLALVGFGLARRGTRPIALLVLLIFAAVTFNGGDWMPWIRFWLPGIPFILVLAVVVAQRAGRSFRVAALALGALYLVSGVAEALHERSYPGGRLHPARAAEKPYADVSAWISERAKPKDVIALMDIGRIGYATGLEIIDISGLVTPWIAKSPGGFLDKRYDVGRILDKQPRFMVLRPKGYAIDRRILAHPRFRAEYRPQFRRSFDLEVPGWEDAEMIVFEHVEASE